MFSILLSILILSSSPSGPSVDPKIGIYLNSPGFRNIIMNPYNPLPLKYYDGNFAQTSVRVKSIDDIPALKALENSHFRIIKRNEKPIIYKNIVAALVDMNGLEMLKKTTFVVRVELDLPAHHLTPTEVTTPLITAPQTWALLDSNNLNVTGEGITIADIDSGIDPFQPAFFFGDGGYFTWIDVDNNGEFEPGVDGVDLNDNGQLDDGEILRYLDMRVYNWYGAVDFVGGKSTGFGSYQANVDYLYADTNNNSERDTYSNTGSNDEPSLGEPFFIADDVNNNGKLDVGEKILFLSSSKIKAYFNDNTIFEGGVNLNAAPQNNDISHGTGVAGILAGGVKGFGKRWGVAPKAKLVSANGYGTIGYFQVLQWVLTQNPDVVIHEYANNFGQFLDGTSNVEVAMDDSTDNGVVHVAAAGNHGGSSKGYKTTILKGETRQVQLHLPGGTSAAPYIQITMLWRDNTQMLDLTLEDPNGLVFDMNTTSSAVQNAGGNVNYYVTRDQSTSGTIMVDLIAWGEENGGYVPLAGGNYTLTIVHPDANGNDIVLAGFSTDSDSGWGEGFKWMEDVSEEHLVGWPGTANNCVTVAAYTGRDESELNYLDDVQGELRDYSGRGIRIDGYEIMDIAAPANPLVPACYLCTQEDNKFGNMSIFGGTSGATPHVAGAAALLKQMYKSETGSEIKTRIKNGALVDSDVLTPGNLPQNEMWGAGKLRIYEAAIGEDAPVYSPPEAMPDTLTVAADDHLTLSPSVSDPETEISLLEVRYDLDYDGIWDTTFSTDKSYDYVSSEVGIHYIKYQVKDSDGFTDEAVISVDVTDATSNNDGGNDGGDDAGNPGSQSDGCSCSSAGGNHSSVPLFLSFIVMFMFVIRRFRMEKS